MIEMGRGQPLPFNFNWRFMNQDPTSDSFFTYSDTQGERDANLVRFEYKAVRDGVKEKELGHVCFKNVEYIRITAPGAKSEVFREARDADRSRYRRAYERFKASDERPADGCLIDEWPSIDRATSEMLKYNKILTVEQLAALPDGFLHVLGMGGRTLRQKAIDYIEAAKNSAPMNKLRDELERLRRDHEMLLDQFRTMHGKEPDLAPKHAEPSASTEDAAPKKNPKKTRRETE